MHTTTLTSRSLVPKITHQESHVVFIENQHTQVFRRITIALPDPPPLKVTPKTSTSSFRTDHQIEISLCDLHSTLGISSLFVNQIPNSDTSDTLSTSKDHSTFDHSYELSSFRLREQPKYAGLIGRNITLFLKKPAVSLGDVSQRGISSLDVNQPPSSPSSYNHLFSVTGKCVFVEDLRMGIEMNDNSQTHQQRHDSADLFMVPIAEINYIQLHADESSLFDSSSTTDDRMILSEDQSDVHASLLRDKDLVVVLTPKVPSAHQLLQYLDHPSPITTDKEEQLFDFSPGATMRKNTITTMKEYTFEVSYLTYDITPSISYLIVVDESQTMCDIIANLIITNDKAKFNIPNTRFTLVPDVSNTDMVDPVSSALETGYSNQFSQDGPSRSMKTTSRSLGQSTLRKKTFAKSRSINQHEEEEEEDESFENYGDDVTLEKMMNNKEEFPMSRTTMKHQKESVEPQQQHQSLTGGFVDFTHRGTIYGHGTSFINKQMVFHGECSYRNVFYASASPPQIHSFLVWENPGLTFPRGNVQIVQKQQPSGIRQIVRVLYDRPSISSLQTKVIDSLGKTYGITGISKQNTIERKSNGTTLEKYEFRFDNQTLKDITLEIRVLFPGPVWENHSGLEFRRKTPDSEYERLSTSLGVASVTIPSRSSKKESTFTTTIMVSPSW